MNTTQTENKNDAVGKAIRLMEALVRHGGAASVRDLAAETGLPRSTAQRFLAALERYGWAAQDGVGGNYRAGMRFFLLARKPVFFEELVRCADAPMERLMQSTGKTAILSVIEGSGGLCIHTCEPAQAVKFVAREGMSVPLDMGATGLVLLAWSNTSLREKICSAPPSGRFSEIALRERVEKIRRLGYAHSREEWMPNAEDLSVPIFDRRGNFAAQLGIAGIAGTFGDWERDLLPTLRKTAEEIAAVLGA